jgi:hypothetical protein
MANVVQFSTKLELQKHLEVNSHMDSAMINQMKQLNLHLLQPRANKSKNLKRDLSTIQCYKCWKMGHYLRECANLLALLIRKNLNSSI